MRNHITYVFFTYLSVYISNLVIINFNYILVFRMFVNTALILHEFYVKIDKLSNHYIHTANSICHVILFTLVENFTLIPSS